MIRNYRMQKMWSICLLLILFLLQFRIFLITESCVTAFCYANFLATNWKRDIWKQSAGSNLSGRTTFMGADCWGQFSFGGDIFWGTICGRSLLVGYLWCASFPVGWTLSHLNTKKFAQANVLFNLVAYFIRFFSLKHTKAKRWILIKIVQHLFLWRNLYTSFSTFIIFYSNKSILLRVVKRTPSRFQFVFRQSFP